MAAKSNKQRINTSQHASSETVKTAGAKNSALSTGFSGELKQSTHLLIMAGIAIICWLFLKACLNNQFTNWDDSGYIQDNVFIKDLSATGIKAIFTHQVMGNYHPLTILSYAIEYSFVALEPWLYYFDNLTLHILDTLLVYWLIIQLTKRPVAGIVTALLFGLHPMHVESVAWISARKDVLYVLFYLSACIAYLHYIRMANGNKWAWYIGVIVLFICSVLAKPVAVTLPVVLLLIDGFEKREWKVGLLVEKIPHLLIAITLGIVALKVQHAAGAMDMQTLHYSFPERIALGCYALITYLWKAVLPIGLNNIYAYPQKVNGTLPFVYYLYLLAVMILAVLTWLYARRNRIVVFGLLIFMVNIALLLQFIQVGNAIIAERYSYLPYIGLFFIAGWYISGYFEPGEKKRNDSIVKSVAGIYMLALSFMSSARCAVWHDTITLWTNAIEKDPRNVGGYNNLGFIYYQRWNTTQDPYEKQKNFDSAYFFLTKAIEISPEYMSPYISLGEMERGAGMYNEARNNYLKALKYHPKDPNMYLGLAIMYYITKNMDSAGIWFRGAIAVDPSPQAYGNYANFLNLAGKTDSALIYYGIAIQRAPDMYSSYLNRARVYKDAHMPAEAIADLDKAIRLNPDLGDLYYERSLNYNQKGNKQQALSDVEKAISKGYNNVDDNYYQGLKR
ncbi:MAG: hypothetical protein JWQ38_2631 [Flavipsychrobacter sp.]|nr:hypothetical protein [Flavipsychrobacter sp.]